MYLRACVQTPTRIHGRACPSARVRARRTHACIKPRVCSPDSYFSRPQNTQAHPSRTPGKHARGHGYRAIAATKSQTLRPNNTTLQSWQRASITPSPNMAQTLDKMSIQPHPKQQTQCGTQKGRWTHLHPQNISCTKCSSAPAETEYCFHHTARQNLHRALTLPKSARK